MRTALRNAVFSAEHAGSEQGWKSGHLEPFFLVARACGLTNSPPREARLAQHHPVDRLSAPFRRACLCGSLAKAHAAVNRDGVSLPKPAPFAPTNGRQPTPSAIWSGCNREAGFTTAEPPMTVGAALSGHGPRLWFTTDKQAHPRHR